MKNTCITAIQASLLALMFVTTSLIQPQTALAQAAESEGALQDSQSSMNARADRLEQDVFGSVSHAALQKRLAKLEKATFGKQHDGSFDSRLNELSTAIRGDHHSSHAASQAVESIQSSGRSASGALPAQTATVAQTPTVAQPAADGQPAQTAEPDRLFEGEQVSAENRGNSNLYSNGGNSNAYSNRGNSNAYSKSKNAGDRGNDQQVLKGSVHDVAIDELLRQPTTAASDFAARPVNPHVSAQASEAARMSATAQSLQSRAQEEARQNHARRMQAFKHGLGITLKTAAVVAVTAAVVYAASSSGGGGMLSSGRRDVCGCHHFRGF